MKHTISLGAGWQSSRMALGAARGEIKPMPDAAIFADTGWEPQAVYDYLEFLESELPFPVYRVRTDSKRYEGMTLRDYTLRATLRDTKALIPLPVFVRAHGEWVEYNSERDEELDTPSGRKWVEYPSARQISR